MFKHTQNWVLGGFQSLRVFFRWKNWKKSDMRSWNALWNIFFKNEMGKAPTLDNSDARFAFRFWYVWHYLYIYIYILHDYIHIRYWYRFRAFFFQSTLIEHIRKPYQLDLADRPRWPSRTGLHGSGFGFLRGQGWSLAKLSGEALAGMCSALGTWRSIFPR